jgi:hypothetical protein
MPDSFLDRITGLNYEVKPDETDDVPETIFY